MTIYLVRHGETRWNVERRLQGRSNSPLTLRGLEQIRAYAEFLRKELAGATDVALCASPLPRTQQTASVIEETLQLSPARCRESELLVERFCGAWEGQRMEELLKRHGESVRAQWRSWEARIGGDGESLAQVHARAQAWLREPRDAEHTIVVTHGIMSRQFRGAYLQQSPEEIASQQDSHLQDCIFELRDGAVRAMQVTGVAALQPRA